MWLLYRPVRMADNLTTFMCRLSWNLGASTSWNSQGLSRPVMGLLFLYLSLYLLYAAGIRQGKALWPVLFKTRWDQNWMRLHLLVACADNVNLTDKVINCIRETTTTTKKLCIRPTNTILLYCNNRNVSANHVAISAILGVTVWIKLHHTLKCICCC
jgi:hypothetical protein